MHTNRSLSSFSRQENKGWLGKDWVPGREKEGDTRFGEGRDQLRMESGCAVRLTVEKEISMSSDPLCEAGV